MRRTCVRALLILAPVAALLSLAGCGSEEKVYDVHGTVTYDGKAVPAGIIYFDPDPTKGGTGPQGFASVKDGKYDTAIEGRGVRGGAYEIRVSAYTGIPANEAPLGKSLWTGGEHVLKKELPKERTELLIDIPKRK